MLTEPTLEKLQAMRLGAMAQGYVEQCNKPDVRELAFDERFGLLVDAEYLARENRRLTTLLRDAKLRSPRPVSRTSTTRHAESSTRRSSVSLPPAGGYRNITTSSSPARRAPARPTSLAPSATRPAARATGRSTAGPPDSSTNCSWPAPTAATSSCSPSSPAPTSSSSTIGV